MKKSKATSISENTANNETAGTREAPLFRYISPGFNRSKYLVLITIRELAGEGYRTDFKTIYVNSGVPYWTLICALPRWIKWNYIYAVMRDGTKQYRLSTKGKGLLAKLDKMIPDIVGRWVAEREQWRKILPDIEDWHRSALIKLLEPMRYHRQGHPGKSIYRIGGIFWKVNRRFPDDTHREMLVLCPVPCHRIFYKEVNKRRKLISGIWQGASKVDSLVALFQQHGIGDTEAKDLIKQSFGEY